MTEKEIEAAKTLIPIGALAYVQALHNIANAACALIKTRVALGVDLDSYEIVLMERLDELESLW